MTFLLITVITEGHESPLGPLAWPLPLPSASIPALRRFYRFHGLAFAFAFGLDPGLKAFYRFPGLAFAFAFGPDPGLKAFYRFHGLAVAFAFGSGAGLKALV